MKIRKISWNAPSRKVFRTDRGSPASGPLRGTAGHGRVKRDSLTDPPRGRPFEGGGVYPKWARGHYSIMAGEEEGREQAVFPPGGNQFQPELTNTEIELFPFKC